MEIGAATQKFTSSNEVLKKELDNINNSIQSELRSIEQQFSSANQKLETELQSNSDELSGLKKSVEERQFHFRKVFLKSSMKTIRKFQL